MHSKYQILANDCEKTGFSINTFTSSVSNLNTVSVSARPRVRFYQGNGTSGGPGTYIKGFNFNPITFGASSANLFTLTGVTGLLVPTGNMLWAGITYDNNTGGTGATTAQLNTLGQGIFSPPTVGSSQDVFFQTSAAGSFVSNSPPGGFFFFGGTPPGNFGWRFTTQVAAVPEPSAFVMLMGCAAAGAGFAIRRRRR